MFNFLHIKSYVYSCISKFESLFNCPSSKFLLYSIYFYICLFFIGFKAYYALILKHSSVFFLVDLNFLVSLLIIFSYYIFLQAKNYFFSYNKKNMMVTVLETKNKHFQLYVVPSVEYFLNLFNFILNWSLLGYLLLLY